MLSLFKKKRIGEEITLHVQGMHCVSCALNIDGALEDIPGVFEAKTSYKKAQVCVCYDPQSISRQQLVEVIQKEGYKIIY